MPTTCHHQQGSHCRGETEGMRPALASKCKNSRHIKQGPALLLKAHPFMQEFKGYIFKIMGGQDKQGFPMKQGVLVPGRVRLLMAPGDTCFRGYGRRKGERRRKSVRGCIVSQDLSVLNLVIVKKGELSQPCTNPEGCCTSEHHHLL